MLIKIKTSRFCRVCNGCVEEQHAQVYLKLTTNTKLDYFPSPGKSGEHCNHLDASPWQGAVQVPTQPLTSSRVFRIMGGHPPHQVSPIPTPLTLRWSLDSLRANIAQSLPLATACQNQRQLVMISPSFAQVWMSVGP